jgi:hypothetical protein
MESSGSRSSSARLVAAGRDALVRGAWEEARTAFEAALGREETPEALEGLGASAWWLDDAETTFEARERAYRLFAERGDRQGAARLAIAIAEDCLDFRGETAVASGWRERAREEAMSATAARDDFDQAKAEAFADRRALPRGHARGQGMWSGSEIVLAEETLIWTSRP